MKAIIDTSILTHLRLAKELGVLVELYEELRATPTMYEEISKDYHRDIRNLVDIVVKPIDFSQTLEGNLYGNKKRFDRLVEKWKKKTDLKDQVDVEVLVAFIYYTNHIDWEMVFANKEARNKFSRYIQQFGESKIRDITDLPKLACDAGLWDAKRCVQYLEHLQKAKYNTSQVRENLKFYKRLEKET